MKVQEIFPRRLFPLGKAFAFEGVKLEEAGGIAIADLRFQIGQDFAAYCGPWFLYRPEGHLDHVAVQRDETDQELGFRFQDGLWHQSRLEVPLASNMDLSASYPQLGRLVLGQTGEVIIGERSYSLQEPIAIDNDQVRILKAHGENQHLLIVGANQLPDIYLFQNRQWFEWSPWLPSTKLRPPRREPPDSYEPDIPMEIPGVTLYPSGDFSVNSLYFRQDAPQIVVALCDPWSLSKAVGVGKELRLTHMTRGETISYRYLNLKWYRRCTWRPATTQPLAEVLWLKPGGIHVLPLLERYHHEEAVQCVCPTKAGTWRINKGAGQRELLRFRTASGDEQAFVFHAGAWHELVATQSRSQKKSDGSEAQSGSALPPRDEADKDSDFKEQKPRIWVERPHPKFGAVTGRGPSRFYFEQFPHLFFHFDGQFTIGNEQFARDEFFERDYHRTYIKGSSATTIEICQCPDDAGEDSDESEDKFVELAKSQWTVDRFRFYRGHWQRQVTVDRLIDRFPWGQLRRFKDWATRSSKQLFEWVDRRFFYD